MKATVMRPTEIDVYAVRIAVAVRYEEEDIPNDFPLREGDVWRGTVELDTGRIIGWPAGRGGEMYMKVCDDGTYELLGKDLQSIAIIEGYVPHGVVPGEYGDYINLEINSDGIITNWPKNPDVSAWFADDE